MCPMCVVIRYFLARTMSGREERVGTFVTPICSRLTAVVLLFGCAAMSPASAAAQQAPLRPSAASLWVIPSNEPPRDTWFAAQDGPPAAQAASAGASGWKRGLLWGGLIGTGLGIVAFVLVDGIPCDTCEPGGSAAEGTFMEFAIGFGVVGAGLGALIGAL